MRVEPDHLIVFAVVAQTGNLTEAATKLHKSQPALSAQLKRLQEAVGEPLYTRHRYGVTLTKNGHKLLPHAQSLLRSLEGARTLVKELQEGAEGHLRISASMTIALYLLPKLLTQFHEDYPKLDINLLTQNTKDAVALMRTGEADIAFIEGPVKTPDFERSIIGYDEIVLTLPPSHALASQNHVTAKDLNDLATIRRETGSGTRAVVDNALNDMGVHLETSLVATGVDTVKEAVLQGYGAAFLSKLAVQRECDSGLLVALPIEAEGFRRPFSMLHPELERCSQLLRGFINFTKIQLKSN